MGPGKIARCLVLGGIALAVMGQSSGELFKQPPAATITYRAAEDRSLDLMVDQQPTVENRAPAKTEDEAEDSDLAPTGSLRDPKDPPPRLDLSRPLEGGWQADPVMLNRRQAGEPSRPNDDVSEGVLGIELRKQF